MAPLIPIAILLVRGLIALSKREAGGSVGGGGPSSASRSPWSVLWWVAASAWGIFAFGVLTAVIVVANNPSLHDGTLGAAWTVAVALGTGGLLFHPWPFLTWCTRFGRPKAVYYLAHALCIFPISGQARSGACLLAALTLARRGDVTQAELDWIERRLRSETRGLGPFGAAFGMHQALLARVAFDAGNRAEGERLREQARAIFGTLTYCAEVTAPASIQKVTWEYLGLDDARLGHWGSLEQPAAKALTRTAFVLREWVRGHLTNGTADKKTAKARARLRSPSIDGLFARRRMAIPLATPVDVWNRARQMYLALVRGDAIGPRAGLNMFGAFDLFTHPQFPHTVVPESIRDKADLIERFHDEVAEVLAKALHHSAVPLFAISAHGPISARVHQRLETELLEELDRTLTMTEAETKNPLSFRTPTSTWLTAAHTRMAFRRVEHSLGREAAAQIWPRYVYVYCNYGVSLAETTPRMRPLAHAVFKSLRADAERFGDQAHLTKQTHNMRVTLGVD